MKIAASIETRLRVTKKKELPGVDSKTQQCTHMVVLFAGDVFGFYFVSGIQIEKTLRCAYLFVYLFFL